MKRPAKPKELRLPAAPLLPSGDQIPGLRIPITFLSSLRANLQMSASYPEELYSPLPTTTITTSTTTTTTLDSTSTPPLRPPHTTAPSTSEKNTLTIPSSSPAITIGPAVTDDDTAAALALIAASVREQRQLAVRAITTHPGVLAVLLLLCLASVKRLLSTGGATGDAALLLAAAWVGGGALALVAVRWRLRGYDGAAARVDDDGAAWLAARSVHGLAAAAAAVRGGRGDEVVVARGAGGAVVGAVVLRVAKAGPDAAAAGMLAGAGAGRQARRRKSSARWTGFVRAWAVAAPHRRAGVGTRLLETVAANCRLRALDGPVAAADHAHAARVLPAVFNAVFDRRDRWARAFLEQVVAVERGL
ncbi:hypothetical protein LOZ50_001655 [Ophidiomyces ophidiicola]|nr:hypothetical protein LOZ50_001655 [Ophidiomyces ophidiicola]